MTLEDAIVHAEEAASDYEGMIEDYWLDSEKLAKCANEQRQIAKWLKELAERRKQPEIIRCKDCKHYHTNVWGRELGIDGMYGNIIVAHNGCDRWTKDMNCVEPEGFCFLAERRTDG